MKHLFLAFFMTLIAIPGMATETSHMLKPFEAQYICMVNNTAFNKEQIAVEVDGEQTNNTAFVTGLKFWF